MLGFRSTTGLRYRNLVHMCNARLIDPANIDLSISYEENLKCLFNLDPYTPKAKWRY